MRVMVFPPRPKHVTETGAGFNYHPTQTERMIAKIMREHGYGIWSRAVDTYEGMDYEAKQLIHDIVRNLPYTSYETEVSP